MLPLLKRIKKKVHLIVETADVDKKISFYAARYQHKLFGCGAALIRCVQRKKGVSANSFALCDYQNDIYYKDIEKVLLYLHDFDVISFDIFDTLLFRTTEKPTDVFRLIENEKKIQGFAQTRIQSEQDARRKKYQECQSYEVTLEEIYQMRPLKEKIDIQSGVQAELEQEQKVCFANPLLKKIFDTVSVWGKKVLLTSDMYLNTRQLEQLLAAAGYENIKTIFVSCEKKISKSDGNLYDYLREQYPKQKIVHIGDNFHSDYKNAWEHHICALHYCSTKQRRIKGESENGKN